MFHTFAKASFKSDSKGRECCRYQQKKCLIAHFVLTFFFSMHGIILCMSPHKAGNELWKFTCVGEHLSILFVGVYG